MSTAKQISHDAARLAPDPRRTVDAVIGAHIRRARQRKGLTQSEIGAPLNVTGVTVQHWELGRSRIPPERMGDLCAILDLPSDALGRLDHIASTDRERALLAVCRRLSDAGQDDLLGCARQIEAGRDRKIAASTQGGRADGLPHDAIPDASHVR